MNLFSRLSLLWKVLLSTSVALTALFAVTGLIVQSHVVNTTSRSLEEEVQTSFQAYDSLWRARADKLASVSLLLSTMSDVRAAFATGHQATIVDTAGELWSKISEENALFVVTDAQGKVLASLGGVPLPSLALGMPVVATAAAGFPRQSSGFVYRDGSLYQVVVTPVYVQSGQGQALLNVLVAGYMIDTLVAQQFKKSTGGSEFLFLSGGSVVASTLNQRATAELVRRVSAGGSGGRISDGVSDYAPLVSPLAAVDGSRAGDLYILRSFEGVHQRVAELRRDLILMWIAVLAAGLALTYA
ncbi:MAG: cache domain-containing protein, partial [Bryobacteraceae bacterium]